MVQSIPTKRGEESSGNPNMNDLYTLCHYVYIILYLYLKWQANNKSKMSWKLKSLGALEWPSTGLTCYHLHDPPFIRSYGWFDGLGHGNQPMLMGHTQKCVRWGTPGTPKNRPQNWFILAATNRFFWTSLLNNDINASAGSRPTACSALQRSSGRAMVPWLGLNDYLIAMFDLLGFLSISWIYEWSHGLS